MTVSHAEPAKFKTQTDPYGNFVDDRSKAHILAPKSSITQMQPATKIINIGGLPEVDNRNVHNQSGRHGVIAH